MEFASAIVPQELTPITITESARVVLLTVSVASRTLSVMLVTLDMILRMVSASLPVLPALVDSSDIMDFVTLSAQLVPASKETSVKELVLLELGPIMEDVTEPVLPNTPLPMHVSMTVLLVHHLSMEFVKLDLKPVLQDNSGMEVVQDAKTVSILVLNAS